MSSGPQFVTHYSALRSLGAEEAARPLGDVRHITVARWMEALRRARPLDELSPGDLGRLLARKERITLASGQVLFREGDRPLACYLLIKGSLQLAQDQTVRNINPGRPLAFEEVAEGRAHNSTAIALEPSVLLRFDRQIVVQLLNRWFLLPESATEGTAPRAEVVRFECLDPDLPLDALLELLARQIASSFGEEVMILAPPGAKLPEQTFLQGSSKVCRACGTPAAMQARYPHLDYIFLDSRWALEPRTQPADKIVYLTLGKTMLPPEVDAPEPGGAAGAWRENLWTVLNPRPRPHALGEPSLYGWKKPQHDLRDPHWSPCVLRLDLERLASEWRPGRRVRLDLHEEQAVDRWARALTGRRVGVALGGGGAWGFYHMALLRGLLRKGVPIDVVTGASMGSVVGAFFCARGDAGLDQLLGMNLTRTAFFGLISTAPIAWFIDRALGHLHLEELEMRFCPVATNLSTGQCAVLHEGPLGLAVRASASAPGLWAPLLMGPARYVDGCVTSNVPASVLAPLGAELVVASNIYPPSLRHAAPWLPGNLGVFLHNLNPFSRILDLSCSGDLLLHQSGDTEAQWAADVLYGLHETSGERYGDPLLGAVLFPQGDEFLAQAERDQALIECVDECAMHWERLKRPRTPVDDGLARLAQIHREGELSPEPPPTPLL
ncbi:MAG TPA: cyclic nucleotide-binding and patatin-like phospholipase domain-containing protein [Polyangia bacterium]|jgi:NTE family protein|nr:cyclic nucleotide-binding and patatin-like phospholipase domain-containing protein [Polyangia bacterium]